MNEHVQIPPHQKWALMSTHLSIDTKEKPYACHHCSDAFSRRDLLRRHEIKAHGISEGLRRRRRSGNSPDANSTMPGIYPSSQTIESFMVDGRSNGSPDTQHTVDVSRILLDPIYLLYVIR